MVRKGVGIIFLLVFAVFLILNFVSAGSCIGTFDCSSLDEYMCEYTSGCYWQGYCVGGTGYSGSPCGDEWDPYYCESMGCQWLGCTGTGSCSDFYYSASLCQSHSGCTWNSGCLYDTECPTGYYCTGTEYCTGTRLVKASWVDPTMPTNPESGVTRLVTPFQLNYNWVAGYESYPKCVWTSGSPGIWDCGPCTYCGEARGNYVAYVVENLGNGLRWYRRDCVWTNVAGLCFNPRWAAGRLDSGPAWVASGYCSAYTPSNCVAQQGCYVVKNYGTCVSSCVPETNTAFCTRLGKNCGSVTANDNCGDSRTVASCGTCTLPETCSASNVCSCTPNCAGLECGDDGCGGSCGPATATCTSTFGICTVQGTKTCIGGVYGGCVATNPITTNCAGLECGNDLCGGLCGTCTSLETCSSGQCIPREPSLYWTDIYENQVPNPLVTAGIPYNIKLVARYIGSPGSTVTFNIKEKDSFPDVDDLLRTETAVVNAYGKAVLVWSINSNDLNNALDGPNENSINDVFTFYFEVGGETSYDLSFEYREAYCDNKNLCADYLTSEECSADTCLINNTFTDCSEGKTCLCVWDDTTGCDRGDYDKPGIDTNLCVYCMDGLLKNWCDMPEGTNDFCDIAVTGCGTGEEIVNSALCDISSNIGVCMHLADTSGDPEGCEDDGYLTYTWGGSWDWNILNDYGSTNPNDPNFLLDLVWRYDPSRESTTCNGQGQTESALCPAQIELPFLGTWGILVTIGLIVLIYVVLVLKKQKPKKRKK